MTVMFSQCCDYLSMILPLGGQLGLSSMLTTCKISSKMSKFPHQLTLKERKALTKKGPSAPQATPMTPWPWLLRLLWHKCCIGRTIEAGGSLTKPLYSTARLGFTLTYEPSTFYKSLESSNLLLRLIQTHRFSYSTKARPYSRKAIGRFCQLWCFWF